MGAFTFTAFKFVMSVSLLLVWGQFGWASMGGVSGGGGNTIPTGYLEDPPTVSETILSVQKSEHKLIPYIKSLRERLLRREIPMPHRDLLAQFLENMPLVLQTIRTRPVEIEARNSCVDRFGLDVDGCIFSPDRNSICISAASISHKINRSQLDRQVLALLMHEYSELVGFNEAEAVDLQRFAIEEPGI